MMFENGQVYGGNNTTVIPNYGAIQGQQQQQKNSKYNNQLLTDKQLEELKSKPVSVQYKINYNNFLASQCTHKANGQIAVNSIEPNEKGHDMQCSVCHETWKMFPLDTPKEDVFRIVDNFVSLLQTLKVYNIFTPQEASNVYVCTAMAKLVPEIWNHAVNEFKTTYKNMSNTNQAYNYSFDNYPDLISQLFASFGGGTNGFVNNSNAVYTNMVNPGMNINNQGSPFRVASDGRVIDSSGLPVDPSARYDVYGRRIGMPDMSNIQTPPMAQYSTQQAVNTTPATQQQNDGMNISPIGFVEDIPEDFTNKLNNMQTTTQTVSVPGVAPANVAQSVPPLPEAPKNPNLTNNNSGGFPA